MTAHHPVETRALQAAQHETALQDDIRQALPPPGPPAEPSEALDNERLLQAVSRSQGMVEFDMTGIVLGANANFLQMTGYELDEIVGRHHRIFVDRDEADGPAYRQFWQKVGRGEFDAGEYLRFGKHQRRVWLQATYNPILDVDGRPLKVVKCCTDITPSKLAVADLQDRLDAVSASNCVLEVDRTGVCVAVNAAMQKALGLGAADLLGKPQTVLWFDEELADPAWQTRQAALREGRSVTGEFRLKGLGEREVWCHGTLSPLMAQEGGLAKVILVAQDNTQAMQARLESAARLNAIDRAQAVIEFDMNGIVLNANANFLQLMDYRMEDIVGRHHRVFVDAREAAGADYLLFWQRLGRGEFASGEFRRLGRHGREVWIQATYNPVFDRQGRPIKVVKFASDVTEAKLRNADFQARVSAIDLGQAVAEFDLGGHLLTANRNFLAAMGYTLREIQGEHHSMFCSPEYIQSEAYRDFWLRLNEGQFIGGRFQRYGKFGRPVWIQATYNPIIDLNGKVSRIVKFAHDVTKEVELEHRVATQSAAMTERVGELARSIAAIADNTGVAAQMAREAALAAASGRGAAEKSMGAISAIQEVTAKVSAIVGVIGEIAGQTNLLAFNAALEAARAGTHGVGFSVVAGEVRRLAERSSQAAHEIARLIENTAREVAHGAEVTRAAAQDFQGIATSVERTGASVSEIAQATERQRHLSDTVKALIDDLAKGHVH